MRSKFFFFLAFQLWQCAFAETKLLPIDSLLTQIEHIKTESVKPSAIQIRNAREKIKEIDADESEIFSALFILADANLDDCLDLAWWQLSDRNARIIALCMYIKLDGLRGEDLLYRRGQISRFQENEGRLRVEELDYVERHWKKISASILKKTQKLQIHKVPNQEPGTRKREMGNGVR